MEKIFIKNASQGKNNWWRYAVSIIAVIAAIAITNLVFRMMRTSLKALFSESEVGGILMNNTSFFIIFGFALITFLIAAKVLHKRPIMSFISVGNKLIWKHYFGGFLIWTILMLLYGSIISDFKLFDDFGGKVTTSQFVLLFLSGFISLGIQTFFEEIMIRGYILQGLHLRIKRFLLLILLNSLIFGLLHFGYGLGSFLSSWVFGISMVVMVIFQNRIEFASGVHNANNLIISLFFWNIETDSIEQNFWSVDWISLSWRIAFLITIVGLAYKFFRK